MYAIGGSANPTINSQGNRYTAPSDENAKEVISLILLLFLGFFLIFVVTGLCVKGRFVVCEKRNDCLIILVIE